MRAWPAVLLAACGALRPLNPLSSDTAADASGVGDTGGDADADADADSDTDADTDASGCTAPDLWDLGAQAPSAGSFNPVYLGVHLTGMVEQNNVLDVNFDGTDTSAAVVFTFFDSTPSPLCSVVFDGSASLTTVNLPATPTGQVLWESWSLAANANDGWTDCGMIGGSTDPRTWVASRYWGIALGQMVDSTDNLRQFVETANPGTWATDWDPYVFATFLDVGANSAVEVGWAFSYPAPCYVVASTTAPAAVPTASFDGYVGNVGDWTVLLISALP